MKFMSLVLVSASILGFTHPGWTQDTNNAGKSTSSPGILGYLDPKTGAFRPMAPSGDASELAPAAPIITGEIIYKITITIKSAIPAGDTIVCSGSGTTFDAGSSVSHTETASIAATRSGSTASCSVTIPYAWALASASSDSVTLGYGVIAEGGAASLARTSEHGLPPIKVPASGTTTTETVAVTI